MIRRVIALILVLWVLGFLWFAIALPQPANGEKTDAIVVPTGSGGRIPRGLALLREGASTKMLVTGVDRDVKPREFAVAYEVPPTMMRCCLTLGFEALDTRGNARETAAWIKQQDVRTLRLVTADWHMRRAALELQGALPEGTVVLRDAVRSQPSLAMLFLEYHKFMATWVVQALPG